MSQYIFSVINSIRLADIIDILLIAFFIYLILIWFQRSRARFMLIGMIIIGGVYALARMFNLYLTTMAFQAFFAIFLIMIVIIFQDDFRHFFERIALWSMQKRISIRKFSPQGIEILGSALANLSRKGIGALVVIRGHDPLDRYLEAGFELDGVLNPILLESIFDPNAPSHDGAVIIDGLRIAKFACHLPLSTNIDEIGRHGTRHAAALGLAEQTDALCIVVSEETGRISVAETGKIRQIQDVTQIQDILRQYQQRKFPKQHRSPLWDFITGHPFEKLVAIVLAVTFWVSFAYHKEVINRDFVLPIEYRNLSSDRVVADSKPKEITITLRGADRVFKILDPKDLKASLDMSAIADGEYKLKVSNDSIKYPTQLSLVNIEPEEVELKVHHFVTLNIPVEPRIIGRLPLDYFLKQVIVEPKTVAVKCSSLAPKETIAVSTEFIDISGLTQTTPLTSKLILSGDARFVDEKLSNVKVTVEIKKNQEEKAGDDKTAETEGVK